MNDRILYHYFSAAEDASGCNYSLNSLQNEKVSFSHISYFNDPCEIALFPDEMPFITFNSDTRYKYELYSRVFCFSDAFQNPLMWGHYGNLHQGFCVGYAYDDIKNIPEYKEYVLILKKVEYVDKIPSLSQEQIDSGDALYYKSTEWEKENEWRAAIRLRPENYLISEAEFIEAKERWLHLNPFFEKAVDSHLRLAINSSSNIDEIKNKIQMIRQGIKNFEIKDFAYSAFIELATGRTVFGKLPMRVECSLKAKVIYIGLNTSERRALKKYAKSNNVEIFEMGIEQGKYRFIPQKIVL